MPTLLRSIAVAVLFLAAAAHAQPLPTLAPPDAVLSLGYQPTPLRRSTLLRELEALPWNEALGSAKRIAHAGLAGTDSPLAALLPLLEPRAALAARAEGCPLLGDALTTVDPFTLATDHLLTVGLNPTSPMPAITLIARVDIDRRREAEDLLRVLVRCYGGPRLEQDGVPLFLLGANSDTPTVIGMHETVFFAGTNPDVVRGVVRRARGSLEPSLADSPLFRRAASVLRGGGFTATIDAAAIADLLDSPVFALVEPFIQSDENGDNTLRDRIQATLRTLGGYAGRAGIAPDGIALESFLAMNPDGGDEALANLLLCTRCPIGRPHLAPAEAYAVETHHVPWRALIAYADEWLEALESRDDPAERAGEGDLRGLRAYVLERFDFGLDFALLDWVGTDLHVVGLEPAGASMSSLLHGSPTTLMLTVRNAEAAAASRDSWRNLLTRIVRDAPVTLGLLEPGEEAFLVTRHTYRDVTVDRYRNGFNIDVGMALFGNNLVIGAPASAVHRLIDTHRGGRNITANAAYRDVTSNGPQNALALRYVNSRAALEAAAGALDALAQPASYVLTGLLSGRDVVVVETVAAPAGEPFVVARSGDDLPPFYGLVAVDEVDARALGAPVRHQGSLALTDRNDQNRLSRYYELTGVRAGEAVQVELQSWAFDTYLVLLDGETGAFIDANDDAPDTTRSELTFRAEPGVRYWIEVTSFFGDETGDYQLNIATAAPRAQPTAAPLRSGSVGFGELLELADFVPRALRVLAARTSHAHSYTSVQYDSLYTRTLVRVDW